MWRVSLFILLLYHFAHRAETPACYTKHMQTSTVYLIDLDRCLIDIEVPYGEFVRQLKQICGSDVRQDATNLRAKIEASGGSFDPVTSLLDAGIVHETAMREVLLQTAEQVDAATIFLPGAKELLAKLQARGERFAILTYGGTRWQTTKLRASGLIENEDSAQNIPVYITAQKQKGLLIASWQQADGNFLLPQELFGEKITAHSIVLIDDKAESFIGFPSEPSHGFYVPAKLGENLQNLPANVRRVQTLHDVL